MLSKTSQCKKQKENYHFLKDPHLIYFLQSPYKISQLLKSRRYKLDGHFLIQIDTNTHFKIDPYVMKKLKIEQIQKMLNFSTIIQEFDKDNKFQEFRKTRVKLQHMITRSTNIKTTYSNAQTPSSESSNSQIKKLNKREQLQIDRDLPYIKGLKEFRSKMLK